MVDLVEKRVYEIVSPFNGRSWRTFKIPPLTGSTSLNIDMKIDEEEAYMMLNELFEEFGMDIDDLNFFAYFPKSLDYREMDKPLTMDMLVESAKARKWIYD